MIRTPTVLSIAAWLPAGVAWAHPGHVDQAAGHSHWLAYGAAALALLIAAGAVALALRRRRSHDR